MIEILNSFVQCHRQSDQTEACPKITTELKEGDAPSQIVETVANGQFDLIVIGHRGDSKIKKLFHGSTSERVPHISKCAVLISNRNLNLKNHRLKITCFQ